MTVIWFLAKKKPENAHPKSAKQSQQSQRIQSTEIQKTRNPEIQESSEMSC